MTIYRSIAVGAVVLALAWSLVATRGNADSGHGADSHDAQGEQHGEGHDDGGPGADLAGVWSSLKHTRDGIAADIEAGSLKAIHEKTEALEMQVQSLLEHSTSLDPKKRERVESLVGQITKLSGTLHVAADAGDEDRTRREFKRLDGLLKLLQAQYPAGSLEPHGHLPASGHSSERVHSHGEGNIHRNNGPKGLVSTRARASVLVRSTDFHFKPTTVKVRAGIPTRIELQNDGQTEHSLVVKTPDGEYDWIHLHAQAGASDAAIYQLDQPGEYRVLCTIPGHTEAGMTGELIVEAEDTHSHHGQH